MNRPFSGLVLGHRGAPYDAPENTIRSFTVAMEQGADGVELDVRGSADGVPVVIHDETLERTTDGRGRVSRRTWADLSEVRSAGEAIPSLERAAEWAADARAWLNVEIKARGVEEATLRVLRRMDLLDRAVISSFDAETVAEVGRLDPSVARYLLTEEWDERARAALVRCGARGVCLHVDAASAVAVQALRHDGLPMIVWTVDDPARVRELLDAGAAAVITNRPGIAVAASRG